MGLENEEAANESGADALSRLPNRLEALVGTQEFFRHPMVAPLQPFPVEPSLALPVAANEYFVDVPLLQRPWSWFAGPPVVPRNAQDAEWPVDASGAPLTHVVQVDLDAERRNVRAKRFDRLPLPRGGVIQVFHDLNTLGWERGDARAHAWEVRWWPKSEFTTRDEFALAQVPPDMPHDGNASFPQSGVRDAVSINADIVPTIPHFLDLELPDQKRRAGYLKLMEWFDDYPHQRNMMRPDNLHPVELTPWDAGHVPAESVSRMCGFGYSPRDNDVSDVLDETLSMAAGDRRVMIFDINPNEFVRELGWFHGGRHLEVWMRESDLEAGRFDAAWSIIRTDA